MDRREMVAADVLGWYERNRRPLPWRSRRDPYRIWVSEIMLQQTRVETVLPYYERFLARFPDVETLARAPLEEVLAHWSGLGYYRRARQMHAAAQEILRMGSFPATLEGLRALPGVGAYTAAAVGSIAFGLVEPVLDGNVERVLSRVLALDDDVKSVSGRRRLHEEARALLDPSRAGDSNQALMEIGATLCKPQQPLCRACPLEGICRAGREGLAESFPRRRARKKLERQRWLAALVVDDSRVLLFRRPEESSLLAGIWEIPWVEILDTGERTEEALASRYGGSWSLGSRLGEVRHTITFRSLRIAIHRARLRGGDTVAEGPEAGWFEIQEVRRLPVSSWVSKALEKAAAVRQGAGVQRPLFEQEE